MLLEIGDQLRMVGNDGQTISGRHEGFSTVYHVAISIPIAGGTKLDAILVNSFNKRARIG